MILEVILGTLLAVPIIYCCLRVIGLFEDWIDWTGPLTKGWRGYELYLLDESIVNMNRAAELTNRAFLDLMEAYKRE